MQLQYTLRSLEGVCAIHEDGWGILFASRIAPFLLLPFYSRNPPSLAAKEKRREEERGFFAFRFSSRRPLGNFLFPLLFLLPPPPSDLLTAAAATEEEEEEEKGAGFPILPPSLLSGRMLWEGRKKGKGEEEGRRRRERGRKKATSKSETAMGRRGKEEEEEEGVVHDFLSGETKLRRRRKWRREHFLSLQHLEIPI